MVKLGCIIQARVSSTRLPEKVLKSLPFNSSISVLEQVIRRVKACNQINEIIVATTNEIEDVPLIDIARKENVISYRGSKENVLERFYFAAKENSIDVIVRITSDCPCIDPTVIDRSISEHIYSNADYSSNSILKKYPHGIDVEVFNFKALEDAYLHASNNFEKEHVTPYFYKTKPEKFKIHSVVAQGIDYSNIRITLDTIEDYILLAAVFDFLYEQNPLFGSEEIIRLFSDKPWLYLINASVKQKRKYETLDEELEEAIKILELQELNQVRDILKNKIKK